MTEGHGDRRPQFGEDVEGGEDLDRLGVAFQIAEEAVRLDLVEGDEREDEDGPARDGVEVGRRGVHAEEGGEGGKGGEPEDRADEGRPGEEFLAHVLTHKVWQPTPVFLPEKSHGPRSLVGYSPWGHKESYMTEQLHFLSLYIYI